MEQQWATTLADIQARSPRLSPGRLRSAARHGALLAAGALARPRKEDSLRCLYLHYVYDDQVDPLRRLLAGLQSLGRFVSAEDAVAMARGEKPIGRRCFQLSFDDGFDNVHRNAFPVLEELGIPATLFVPTARVGASEARQRELWWMHQMPLPTRSLDWQALEEMSRHGHEVGSHTRTHSRLSEVSGDPERLAEEVEGSKREIEDALGRPCRYISWPYGREGDIDATAREAIRKAGYEACFSAERGRVEPGCTSLHAIPRHHFEPEWPWLHLRYFALGGWE